MITVNQVKEKTPERFWSKIKFAGPDECWEWQKGVTKKGYGDFRINTVRYRTHRFIFIKLFGDLPRNIMVCHSCDNPKCCNPNHLFAGTSQDNVDDRDRKGRTKVPGFYGSKHGSSKITEADVIAIRKRRDNGERYVSIAKDYKVGRHMIRLIALRKWWKQVI